MAHEKPWRPADFLPLSVCLQPEANANWAVETPGDRRRAHAPSRRHRFAFETAAGTAWKLVAFGLACGLVIGSAATLVTMVMLRLA